MTDFKTRRTHRERLGFNSSYHISKKRSLSHAISQVRFAIFALTDIEGYGCSASSCTFCTLADLGWQRFYDWEICLQLRTCLLGFWETHKGLWSPEVIYYTATLQQQENYESRFQKEELEKRLEKLQADFDGVKQTLSQVLAACNTLAQTPSLHT